METAEILDVARKIIQTLEDKKAEDIVLLDIQEVAYFADYFVVCSGTSNRMLDALLEAVVEKTKGDYQLRPRVEGVAQDGWILADFGALILHIFSPDQRMYYQLEELWSEAKVLVHVQ